MSAHMKGWHIHTSECGCYLYVSLGGKPGELHIKADGEGFVVDIWSDVDDVIAGTSASYSELEAT